MKKKNPPLPDKDRAMVITKNAIRKGLLIKKDCEACGSNKSECHHLDYSKPLKVMCWQEWMVDKAYEAKLYSNKKHLK